MFWYWPLRLAITDSAIDIDYKASDGGGLLFRFHRILLNGRAGRRGRIVAADKNQHSKCHYNKFAHKQSSNQSSFHCVALAVERQPVSSIIKIQPR